MRDQVGVCVAKGVDHARVQLGEQSTGSVGIHANAVGVLDRTTDDPSQHVPAPLVRGRHAVGGQEAHAASVVDEHAHRLRHGGVVAVGASAALLGPAHDRQHRIDLEDRDVALQDRRDPLEAHAGVDVLRGQLRETPFGVACVLHEHEVVELQVAIALVPRLSVRPPLGATVVEDLAARTARTRRAGLPEVVRAERDDAIGRNAHGEPVVARLRVQFEAQFRVALVDRHPDPVERDLELVDDEVPRHLDGALFEVVAEREVAEHLEERHVPRGEADFVDVGRAEALLTGREALAWGCLDTGEVGLERLHARDVEEDGRVVRAGHERGAGHLEVAVVDGEMVQEQSADLGTLHAGNLSDPAVSPRPEQRASR